MSHVQCPMCKQIVSAPGEQRGILINAVASVGARITNAREQIDRLPKNESSKVAIERLMGAIREDQQRLAELRKALDGPIDLPRAVVLYRDQGSPSEDEAERAAILAAFGTPPIRSRLEVRPGDLVIGRYSVLPFYRELEAEVRQLGGHMLNTASQHEYVADIQNWYYDLKDLTAQTWFRLEDVAGDGPFVLKGGTNSRKQDWATHMFAANRREASRVYSRLASDGLVGRQQIVIRRYVPLVTYGTLLNDLPVTNEFRFLVAAGRVIGAPFYWSSFVDDVAPAVTPTEPSESMVSLVREVIDRIGEKASAYTVDVAETQAGDAILIELNDLQMAGLSGFDPATFYTNLVAALVEKGVARHP